jgi:uncharacterized protein
MLRTSSYTICVDLPDDQEHILLVHGYSGAMDKMKKEIGTYLRSQKTKYRPKPLYGEWSPEPPINETVTPPSQATIEFLKRRCYLTEKTVEEEEEFFVKMATKLHHYQSRLMPNYILMTTYQCNLRCPYCFQDHIRTNPAFSHLLKNISPEMVDRIFAAMPKLEASHGLPEDADIPRPITFYGGESLLAENRATIEYIMNKAFSMGKAHFSAITNGTDLQAYKDLLGPGKIASLQITLDGPQREHDKRRIYANGDGSFEKIAQNITMALDLGVNIDLRMNIDRNNIAQLPELADEIVKYGWNKYENFMAYTSPITPENDNIDRKTLFNSWQLDRALTQMRQDYPNMEIIKRPDDPLISNLSQLFKGSGNPFLKEKSLPQIKGSFCGAHDKMYVIDPFGDLYACWSKTGDQKIRIGHIDENSEVILNEEMNQTWRNRSVISNPTCRKCSYALYCGGGCALLAMHQQGTLYANHCDGFANRFRASVAQAYQDVAEGKETLIKQGVGCGA